MVVYSIKKPGSDTDRLDDQSDQQVLGFKKSEIKTVFLDNDIVAAWYFIPTPLNLKLKSNLEKRQTAQDIFENEGCLFLASSGFYDQEGHHLGLFQYKQEVVSPLQSNEFLNGYLTVNQFGTPMIGNFLPNNLYLGLQSGPLLYQNGQRIELNLKSDKYSRRIVAAVTGENKLLFIALYSNKQNFSGPLLGDVPRLLSVFIDKTDLKIADAINLDGGKASAFLDQDFRLTEISFVGGYFCYTP